MSSTPVPPATSQDATLSPLDWLQIHSKKLTIGVIAALVVAAGIALWKRSEAIKQERAEQAYYAALRGGQTGNMAQVQTELGRIVTRYGGTNAGTQAAMSLATMQYEAGNYAAGIQSLENAKAAGVPDVFKASVEALIASGLADQGKPAEAAARYEAAARMAQFETDKHVYRAEAARSLMVANRNAEALAIWKELMTDPESPVAAEARVRVGELGAGVAGK
jgi:predicted negative regulator of RcsB-dependent stress response